MCQWIEACLQTVVKYNPWFPDEGSFDLEIWNWVKENVEQAARWGENIPINFWPLWTSIKAVILPFQGNSSPPDICQQVKCSLYEYKLHDKTLQKAQLQKQNVSKLSHHPCSGCPKCSSSFSCNGHETKGPRN